MRTKIEKKTIVRNTISDSHPLAFYQKLKRLDSFAICQLQQKIHKHLMIKKSSCRSTSEDIEELSNDAALIVLQKILDGTYQFQGSSPVTFAYIVANNLLRNFCRKKKIYCYELEEVDMPQAPEVETYFAQKELELKIGKAMSALNPAAQQIIRLKYFEGLSDTEVIEKKLTIYTTVDSLKNRRCQSLKKLADFL